MPRPIDTIGISRLTPTDAVELYCVVDANRIYLDNMVWAKGASLELTRAYLVNTKDVVYGIYNRGYLAGVVSLRPIAVDSWMIGYWLGEYHRGRGIVPKAAQLMFDAYLIGAASKRTVVATVRITNTASHSVLRKLGFKPMEFDESDSEWVFYTREFT